MAEETEPLTNAEKLWGRLLRRCLLDWFKKREVFRSVVAVG